MSNERVIAAAEAVDDLRDALARWCQRSETEGSPLGVRAAADEASAAIQTAVNALHAIHTQVRAEARSYDRAKDARTSALLGEILIRPLAAAASIVPGEVVRSDYQCGDCGRVFVIDPADPMTAHGLYLDHMDEHERDDLDDDAADKASELDCQVAR